MNKKSLPTTQVDEALTNKEDLKAKVSSALGGDGAAAAPAAPAEAAA